MEGIEKGIKVFNCYAKTVARIESDCVLTFGFMFLKQHLVD